MTVLFNTIGGSRLYGLDNPDSDWDWTVVLDGRAKPRQFGEAIVCGIFDLIEYANGGAHQFVEAVCSPYKTWYAGQDKWEPYLNAMRFNNDVVLTKYRRAAKNMPRPHHRYRLEQDIQSLSTTGRLILPYPEPARSEILAMKEKETTNDCNLQN